jgi:peptide chain release factor 1
VKESFRRKLENLAERHEEIAQLLATPDAAGDTDQFRRLSMEYSQLDLLVGAWHSWVENQREIEATQAMLQDPEPEVRALAADEMERLRDAGARLEKELEAHLVPRDPHDDANLFLEIRAGTGGDEAAIFAGDLLQMYARYAERRNWQLEILSASEGEHGGYREVIARLIGRGAYSRLKFESGAHRVQRVPETESQGRIHTSAATVAILPELEEVEMPEINPADLRIDTYRASGAGGQHVNRTDSAVRLTHLPTGFVVECQDERSQHKNKARAMNLLAARIYEAERNRQAAEQSAARKSLVGSGDRSERIRTYNFPQGRITDHRINLTIYRLDDTMAGDLDPLIDPLTHEYQAEQLAALADD